MCREKGRTFEIIRNSECYLSMNVKIVATHTRITVGLDGGLHQAISVGRDFCKLVEKNISNN